MKRNLKRPLAIAALCLAAGAAHAQTATLNISGRITNTPCTITADAVNLGDMSISDFGSASVAPEAFRKTFNITLNGCALNTLSLASLKFGGITVNDATTLALTAGTGMAQGFGVRVLTYDSTHSSGTQVVFNGTQQYLFNNASNKNVFTFQAFYVKHGSTQRPGTANASATVTLTYA